MKKIKTVLVANRGEIAIRVFRACSELGIHTVAIYSKEDELSLHRYKADEAYLVGEGKEPVAAYLDIEGILKIAKAHNVDAIHPGYGFLSENIDLARRCQEEGFIFIGPELSHLSMFGDKINARKQAKLADIPMIPGSDGPVKDLTEVKKFAKVTGYPFIIKAVSGGGGRGMRIVRSESSIEDSYYRAKSEAKVCFGNDEVYVERLLENPKHIEVQILGDKYGNIVHLYERDCSVQRRHQKLVEIAPSVNLPTELRQKICAAAVKLMKNVGYVSAGTVEFLVTPDGSFYFIEVNPRIQVEHTITELITGIDIVQSQIMIADGYRLFEDEIGIASQDSIQCNGHAIQCRITTEDPANNFMPDSGKITAYRSSGGFGIRLDAGNAYTGAVITPHYDSLLVKLSTWGLTHKSAITKMLRGLCEFRIRGIKTNLAFLENVVKNEQFQKGTYDTSFVDTAPELFVFTEPLDRGTKLLRYLGNVTVNGLPGIKKEHEQSFKAPRMPQVPAGSVPDGTKQILDCEGPEGLIKWIKQRPELLYTDTTWRDAHQSLLATRIRSYDMLRIAEPTSKLMPNLFSLEMWGGATFDVAYRFLKEDPWQRLKDLRERVPNVLFQMLLRASNAVGYTNYPDNVVKNFVLESAKAGIDVFRVFDSLNWLEGMKVAIDAVRCTDRVVEGTMCYTGDILDPARGKYDITYYVNLAKELEKSGSHILGIKDMAGLLKPEAAYQLISALKDAIDIPIHLHTHDTSGNGIYTCAKAAEAGVDIVDVAISAMAGMTSQPCANTLFYALAGSDRQPHMDAGAMNQLSHYWEDVRKYYKNFETGLNFPNPEIYEIEMPGGQYSNLKQQAIAVGMENRWEQTKQMYRNVNKMFGDIIKVTPSSKVVGDMALYMLENKLTEDDIYDHGDTLNFPNSVVEFFEGQIGQPYQGFPKELQRIILKGKKPLTDRPGKFLQAANFAAIHETLNGVMTRQATDEDVLAYALYPKVFLDWIQFAQENGNVAVLDTPSFFYGLTPGKEINVEIEQGKIMVVKLLSISDTNPDGTRLLSFELNGLLRELFIKDHNIKSAVQARRKAEKNNPCHVGATMSGSVVKILVQKGAPVKKGMPLLVTEAMKMETTLKAAADGTVSDICVEAGDMIETGDLLMQLAAATDKAE